jgi:hypothetical protein
MDKSTCTGCFTVPSGFTVGSVYTFQWYWVFNEGSAPYTTCWEAKIVTNPGTGTGTGSSGTQSSGSSTVTGTGSTGTAPTVGDAIVITRYPTTIPYQGKKPHIYSV